MLSYQPAPVTASPAPHVRRGTMGFAGRPSSGALTPTHHGPGLPQAALRSLTPPPRRDVSPGPSHAPKSSIFTTCASNANNRHSISRTATPQRVRVLNPGTMAAAESGGQAVSVTPGGADSGSHTPPLPQTTQSHEPILERSTKNLSTSSIRMDLTATQQQLQRQSSQSQLRQVSQQQNHPQPGAPQTLPQAPVSLHQHPQQQQSSQPESMPQQQMSFQRQLPPAPQVDPPQHQQHHSWSGHSTRQQSLPQMARPTADAPRVNLESNVPTSSFCATEPLHSGVSTPCTGVSSMPCHQSNKEQALFREELSLLNDESSRITRELRQVKAEMTVLRKENEVMQREKAEWETAQSTLANENSQLWEQLQQHRKHISELTRTLKSMQEQLSAQGVQKQAIPKPAVDINASQTKSNEVMQLRRDLATAHTASVSAEKAWIEERDRLRNELHEAHLAQQRAASVVASEPKPPGYGPQYPSPLPPEAATAPPQTFAPPQTSTGKPQATSSFVPPEQSSVLSSKPPTPPGRDFAPPPSPMTVPALGGGGGMPDPARLLEDMKKRVAKKVETIATPPSGAFAVKAGAAPQSKEGELTRRLLELKAQMNAVEQQGETLRAATKNVEDEYRNFSAQSTLPPSSTGRSSLSG